MISGGGEAGFGRYRLLRVIATDAVSTTYFATINGDHGRLRTSGGDHFAVRIGDPVDANDEHAVDTARLYLSEAQRAGVVDHPTVVRPRDLGMINGRPYVATPFVRAVPLRELLAHEGTVNHSAVLAMFAQLAGALDAAHRAGVVHGALSPHTIWVGPSAGAGVAYVVYLTGFGTARLLRERMAVTPGDDPVDDVLYVSPEQLRGDPASGASDQYALACAVYHTLIGRPPYARGTRAKLYGAHLLAPPPTLLAADPGSPAVTSAALARGMAKDPVSRFPSCGALIHEALPAGQEAPPGPATAPGSPRRRGFLRPARWWVRRGRR